MYTYFKVQCSVWNGHPFSLFPLSKSWKDSNFPSLSCFYQKDIFIFILSRSTWFYTNLAKNFLGEDPQTPSSTHLQYQNYHVLCVFVKREACNCTKGHALLEINLYGNNCPVSQFKPNFSTTLRFLPGTFSSFFFFFFCLSKFSEIWTPSDENSWIRACTVLLTSGVIHKWKLA